MKKIAFIGSGTMGTALATAACKGIDPSEVVITDVVTEKGQKLADELGCNFVETNGEAIKAAHYVVFCVKPQFLYGVIDEIKNSVSDNTVIVSIVAGQAIETIEKAFEHDIKLVRVMPNTPALVGEGMAALTPNSNVTKEETDVVVNVFNSFGKGEVVSENLMDAVTAVSGSSPAYVFMMIEAMADAAVIGGMPRSQAYTFAAQAVLGSAKMVLETGKHPGELKDMVCSPAGTTIDAVAILEKDGFRNSIIDAMVGCMNKSKELGKK